MRSQMERSHRSKTPTCLSCERNQDERVLPSQQEGGLSNYLDWMVEK